MQTPISHLRLLLFTFCFGLAQPFVAVAQTSASPLPPAAQEALDKGIIAARVPDYLLAIRYFEEARKLAPQAPVVFLNMGLAESRIPGRELRAMAWFGAYLAAAPDATNAAAVREQISTLEVRNQSDVSRLIKTVQDTASPNPGGTNDLKLNQVATLWAKNGDSIAALRTTQLIWNFIHKNEAHIDIAISQAKTGDTAGAYRTAELIVQEIGIGNASYKGKAQSGIAKAQAENGDIAGAMKTASLIQDADWRASGQIAVAEVQRKTGDIVGAKATLASAQQTANHIDDGSRKYSELIALARVQIRLGDIPGGQKTLASALQTSDFVTPRIIEAGDKRHIAEIQIEIGDVAGAHQTLTLAKRAADLIEDSERKLQVHRDITKIQEKARLVDVSTPTYRSTPTAFPVRSLVAVSDWLKKLDDESPYSDSPLNTGPFLDMASHLKPASADPQKIFESLHKTAKTIVEAQNVIVGMLKQQARK